MTGRHHKGDENGQTYYTSAKLVVNKDASNEPAPPGTLIVPDKRQTSAGIKESESYFYCDSNMVMTGRMHTGDENGTTQYEYATLKAITPEGESVIGTITVEDVQWETVSDESSGMGYDAPLGRVIVGRSHSGDENGSTRYATGVIKFNGHPTEIKNYTTTEARKESSGYWFRTSANEIMTGRHHYGDENGNTYHCMGVVSCDVTVKEKERFRVIVALHPGERHYPMNPLDFIRLSRFRRHIDGGEDYGYNKNTGSFVSGNSHAEEYYNIPVATINSYYVKEKGTEMYNVRPKDKASAGLEEVFLEPDDNLCGDFYPNGRIPVFTYSTFYTKVTGESGERREFWLFYGYDDVDTGGLRLSHQGDWERVILDIVNDKIQGAWLDQHGSSKYHTADQLELSEVDGIQTLRVYSARGLHATYNKVGEFDRPVGAAHDHTGNGYQWEITSCTEPLNEQPWKLYAGAWGEVGAMADTTGPLGPWHKIYDFGKQTGKGIAIPLLISANQLLLIPQERVESEEVAESANHLFEAPENMIMTGRKHNGDENGTTHYQYAKLVAVNIFGMQVAGEITIVDREWSDWQKESSSDFRAAEGRVITGREHSGDENGSTRYQTGIVHYNGNPAKVVSTSSLLPDTKHVESCNVYFITAPYFVIIGRKHSGDENGETIWTQGYICIDKS